MATQKFREQQEEERRRRIEEQRLRDSERRTQVEERKKALLEAEKERREAMLRRTEDRGNRMELKRRNERGSIAFAFGSSTPRMLEPVESLASYWGPRRYPQFTHLSIYYPTLPLVLITSYFTPSLMIYYLYYCLKRFPAFLIRLIALYHSSHLR